MRSFAYCCQEDSWNCCITPDFPTYSLPKRMATFKRSGGIQFREISATTCTQVSYDCTRTVRNFRMWFLAICYQEHCRNDIWPKVHRPTLLPKRNATFLKSVCGVWSAKRYVGWSAKKLKYVGVVDEFFHSAPLRGPYTSL